VSSSTSEMSPDSITSLEESTGSDPDTASMSGASPAVAPSGPRYGEQFQLVYFRR
jgi:hypothetical protein